MWEVSYTEVRGLWDTWSEVQEPLIHVPAMDTLHGTVSEVTKFLTHRTARSVK
jgi:hypothetical protein